MARMTLVMASVVFLFACVSGMAHATFSSPQMNRNPITSYSYTVHTHNPGH